MKTTKAKNWTAVCAAVLTTTAMFRAAADQPTTAAGPESSFTGTVVSVDPQEHLLNAKGILLSRQFNLGTACTYTLPDKQPGTITDLRPGEKVTVGYQDSHGVLIANRVEQQLMRYEGVVQSVDSASHSFTMRVSGRDKTFQIADDCDIVLRGGKAGAPADIQTGNRVTVTYETPGNTLMAREIAQMSSEFTGKLTAIDLDQKMLKAKTLFATKKFNVANDCAIVINGKPTGRLSDLKPNDDLVFSYDEINGVNVVNRIAPATEARSNPVASSTTPAPMSGY